MLPGVLAHIFCVARMRHLQESYVQSSIGGVIYIYIYILGGFSERKATPERLEEIVKKVVKQVHRLENENVDY